MSSHAANYKKSERLQGLYSLLGTGDEYTTAQIQSITGSMAIHSDVHELRQNGFDISCRYVGIQNNRKIFAYKMNLEEVKIS